jgi:hypothetical protein
LPQAKQALLLGKSYFPNLISSPFMVGLHGVFYLSAAMCLVAALASFLRGKRYVHEQVMGAAESAVGQEEGAARP